MKIKKKNIQPNLQALEKWATNYNFDGIQPDFVNWFEREIGEIADSIRNQDFDWAIQSRINHVNRIMRDHRAGYIISVNASGHVFKRK